MVYLISHPDMSLYARLTVHSDKLIRRPLTLSVDESPQELHQYAAYLSALHKVRDAGSEYPENSVILEHLFLTFLIPAERPVLLDAIMHWSGRLHLLPEQHLNYLIGSGTLFAWREILTNNQASLTQGLRNIANDIYYILRDRLGLNAIFNAYGKEEYPDGTFDLIKLS